MALIIRMRQQGSNGRQTFRIVLTDSRHPRDGKYVEKLGWYSPCSRQENNFLLDVPRIEYWIGMGAQISDRVKALVKKSDPEAILRLSAKKQAKREKARLKRRERQAKKK